MAEDKSSRNTFLERLKELLGSFDFGEERTPRRYDEIPPGFGWTETEEEYQRAQKEWLSEVQRKRKQRGE